MKNLKIITAIVFITVMVGSCGKKDATPSNSHKLANMKLELSYTGDINSQGAVFTCLAADANTNLASNIVNEETGVSSAAPFILSDDFSATGISFHSESKVSYVKIMLSISQKPVATLPQDNLAITIKIYYDGKLADSQTFSYDKVFDPISSEIKSIDYQIDVK